MFAIDFEDPKVKSILRVIQYSILTLLVVGGTIILIYAGQGYDVDRGTGQVIQNGLVLVNSSPEDAIVSINGQAERDSTPGRFALPAGEYLLSINKDGYRDWTKRINLTGSEVEWLYYPLLIPNDLKSQQIAAFRNLQFIGQSPNGQRYLIRQAAEVPVFSLVSIGDTSINEEESITLPGDLLTGPDSTTTISFEGWADDNRHVLLKRIAGKTAEYLWVDLENADNSRNITRDFDLNFSDARFIDGNANRLYVLIEGDLRRIDLEADTVSVPLVRDVKRYVLYKNRFVVFTRSPGDSQPTLGLVEDDGEPLQLLELTGSVNDYTVEFSEFDDEFHLALLNIRTGKGRIMTNPHNLVENLVVDPGRDLPFSRPGARWLSFSRNGQFVAAQGQGKFWVYDFDREREFSFSVPFAMPNDYEAAWLDGFRFLAHDRDNLLHVFEFDGANQQELMQSNPDFNVILDNNASGLLSVSPASPKSKNVFLSRTPLRTEN